MSKYRLTGMARTKRTEDVRKVEEAKKIEEVNKKTAEAGKLVGRRAQTASYKKSKEMGKGSDAKESDERSISDGSGGSLSVWRFCGVRVVGLDTI
ncbi:hypothetical protein Sjap_016992 [Stephania japonica]|uniref:Uncharacterized protein n=1 Tax=Stephania japonica TaxID=461633 RepID=A0AAP0I5B1_9MAGN